MLAIHSTIDTVQIMNGHCRIPRNYIIPAVFAVFILGLREFLMSRELEIATDRSYKQIPNYKPKEMQTAYGAM